MSQAQKGSTQLASVNDKPAETLNQSAPVTEEVGEIVRDVGMTVVKEAAATLPNMIRSLLGQPLPLDYDPKKAGEKQAEEKYWKEKYLMSESLRQEQQARSLEKQQAQMVRVEQLRDYMKIVLTPSVAKFAHEVDNALLSAQATSDTYTEHFLTQMLSTLLKINKKISKASAWMSAMSARSAKKGPFFMAGKNRMQVDSYMSGERAVSFGG